MRPVNYLSNRNLLEELRKSNKKGVMTNELGKMLLLLVSRYGKKGNWSGYTYNQDMQGYAIMMLMRTWQAFDVKKGNNPFAFFTQCIKHSFIQYLNHEKKQRNIRDELLLDQGLAPSYGYKPDDRETTFIKQDEGKDLIKIIGD